MKVAKKKKLKRVQIIPIKHIFLNTHLGYPLNDIVKIQLSPFRRGIPLPGSGIVGKNWSAWNMFKRSSKISNLLTNLGPILVALIFAHILRPRKSKCCYHRADNFIIILIDVGLRK